MKKLLAVVFSFALLLQPLLAAAQAHKNGGNGTGSAIKAAVGTGASAILAPEVKKLADAVVRETGLTGDNAKRLSDTITSGIIVAAAAGYAGNELKYNYLTTDEAKRKKDLELKESFLGEALTDAERGELSRLAELDKARDAAIRAACGSGNKGSAGCGELIEPARAMLAKYGDNVSYSLLYKDLYPQDAQNLENILHGLDSGSILRDDAISAIAKASGVDFATAARRYDIAMRLHAVTSALAGAKLATGIKRPTENVAVKAGVKESAVTGEGKWKISQDIKSRLPDSWSIKPNKKGNGFRWQDPGNQGNGVRIDQGDPHSAWPTQQVDHVIVRSNGKVIGRDGKPILGSIIDNAEKAHVPLEEYKKWKNWNSPN